MKEYQPIEDYGIIGDLNSVALVSKRGSIDFMCFPDFDSPTVFAAMLDKEKGGYFNIHPLLEDINHKQLYLPETNVLLTRFLSEEGVAEITDFMPEEEMYGGKEIIRRVACIKGQMRFKVECCPRFNYARSAHSVEQVNDHQLIFRSEGDDQLVLRLKSSVPLQHRNGDGYAEFTLAAGGMADFLLEEVDVSSPGIADLRAFVEKSLFDTINYWKNWSAKCNYRGRWMEVVHRSALVLKLMTSYRYGSIVAAPTFGLPEELGGVRNWDYRYTWIRDASFTIYALINLGYKKEATAFMKWVEKQCDDIGEAGYLRLMYNLDGSLDLHETELNYLEGYKQSRPVRIGNGAYDQIQLDIYGELLDSVYLYDKYVQPISFRFWQNLSNQVDWVCQNWQRPDEGIWEVRGGKQQFLYSKLMCWVAIDRGLRIARNHSYPTPPHWQEVRDNIFYAIHNDYWDEELQAFVQYKGAKTVDAATLLMPLIRFISPTDPQWLSTLERIEEELVSDSMVYRYRPNEEVEGLTGGEGTFSMCTFWYVECLARAGQLDKATLFFEKMLGYANHVGLYAEQLGAKGEHLGNFPQAFTHLGLISAALSLDKELNKHSDKGTMV
ncbi:GH15 family glucan-1,4-alpha-glucosidase [Pontibacter ummariensis]|uniref:Glucoamylase (Glucan-1,4-alpha-glucosidase), GH15 family n=1 Tax=Pontibacter ummariensis TaxID=1610492 RepID=A0A239GQP7_9BACT|nr:glycoside hydrolase family 15 protein [Pontibacter ummariensis]PRY11376.1 GH15 family glucan-1,4-alpha-glucosidase [Pontibacter ummariensis]SNS71142.1 Glucoamylase (glucan-1,4-alpha-glucosidase), GH15 family [Pontibacter ummariensis]